MRYPWKSDFKTVEKTSISEEKATSNPLFRTGRQMQKREPERSQPYSGKDILCATVATVATVKNEAMKIIKKFLFIYIIILYI